MLQLCTGSKLKGYSDFFADGSAAWPTLRRRLDSIKFFVGNVAGLNDTVAGGLPQVARFFASSGIDVDFEAGGLRGFDCDGAHYAASTLKLLAPLLDELAPAYAKAGVSSATFHITFDGPFAHSLHQDTKLCPYTWEQAAQQVKANVDKTNELVAARYGDQLSVRFRWNEPAPWYSVGSYPAYHNGTVKDFGDLLQLIDVVTTAGVGFEAFHVDSPLNYNVAPGGYEKLGALMSHVRASGLTFGKYFNDAHSGLEGPDAAYENATVSDATLFVSANGPPDDAIAESWYHYPHTALPEDADGSMAQTALRLAATVDSQKPRA